MTATERDIDASGADAGEDSSIAAPLADVAGYLLRRAHTLFSTHWQLSFRGVQPPITPVQGGMLVLIKENAGLSQSALARMMNVEGPTLLQSLDKLEQFGCVQRVRRPGDRRSYALHLTEVGLGAVEGVRRFLRERETALLGGLDEAERRQLVDLLTRVIDHGQPIVRTLQAQVAAPSKPVSPER